MDLNEDVMKALGAQFPDDEVEFLPKGNFEGKARAIAYIDARCIMRRLDAVVGPENWSFDYDLLTPDGKMVKGKLTVCGVTKCDAGEGGSEDEVLKSAVSDAIKRCGVHFGIGRYLYYLPSVWTPYDQRKRQFSETPRLSPAAIEKALAICGITAAPRGSQQQRPAPPAGGSGQVAPERKSVWAAGAEGRTREAAPESSGDRASAAPKPAPPAPTQATLSGTSTPAEKCAKCHAPAGKPHAKSCDQGAQVPGAFR